MAAGRTHFFGILTARLTGLNALSTAGVFAMSSYRTFTEGSGAAQDLVIWPLPMALCFFALGLIFLTRPLASWLIRSRYFYHWRMIFAVAKLLIAGVIWCGLMVAVLMSLPFPETIFLVFMHVTTSTLFFAALFVFPGGYAAQLGAEVPPPVEYVPRGTGGPSKVENKSSRMHMLLAVPLFIVAAAGLYGDRMAHFVPTLDLSNFAYQSSLIFLMYCLILGVVAAHFGRMHKTGYWVFAFRPVNFLVAPAVFLALGVMTFTPAVTKGLPDIHARLISGPDATTTVRVTGLIDAEENGGCEHGVTIISEVYSSTRPHEICGLKRALWRNLVPGDNVTLIGYRTLFGFRYTNVVATP